MPPPDRNTPVREISLHPITKNREYMSITLADMRQQFDKAYRALTGELQDIQACFTAHQPALAAGRIGLAMLAAQALRHLYMAHLRRLQDEIFDGAKHLRNQSIASEMSATNRKQQFERRNTKWVLKAFELSKQDPSLGPWELAGKVSRKFQQTDYAGSTKAVYNVIRTLASKDRP